jgi:hypothetical protein
MGHPRSLDYGLLPFHVLTPPHPREDLPSNLMIESYFRSHFLSNLYELEIINEFHVYSHY